MEETMRRLLLLVVGCAVGGLLLTGCSGEDDGDSCGVDPATLRDQPLVTAGGCECPTDSAEAKLTLDCFCAEFPDACPSYEEAKSRLFDCAPGYAVSGPTESSGCGQRTVSNDHLFSSSSSTYDDASLQLVGARVFSDVPYGPCADNGVYIYSVGETTCDTATTCSLCEGDPSYCSP